MDISVHRELCQLIEGITTSGESTLDGSALRSIKRICKTSDHYVKAAFSLLMSQLEREHSQIRLSSFLLIDELFSRSHVFRQLLVDDLQSVFCLCVGTEASHPLPPPHSASQALRRCSLLAISRWQEKFGEHYRKLSLGYHYLKTSKKVDFANLEAHSVEERRRTEAEAERQRIVLQRKVDFVKTQMNDLLSDMESCLVEMENCFQLLLPDVKNFEPQTTEHSGEEGRWCRAACDEVACSTAGIAKANDNDKQETADLSSAEVHKLGKSQHCSHSHEATGDEKHSSLDTGQRGDCVYARATCSPTKSCAETSLSSPVLSPVKRNRRPSRQMSISSIGDDEEPDNIEGWEEDESGFIQTHGLGSGSYSLTVDLSRVTDAPAVVRETDDNTAILTTLNDSRRLISRKYLPVVSNWLSVLTKCGRDEEDLLRRVIDLKRSLSASCEKFADLHVVWHSPKPQDQSSCNLDSDTDNDFEDVPEKEGLEESVVPDFELEKALRASRLSANQLLAVRQSEVSAASTAGTDWGVALSSGKHMAKDPTTMMAQLHAHRQRLQSLKESGLVSGSMEHQQPCTDSQGASSSSSSSSVAESGLGADDRKARLLSQAPSVPFDATMLDWESQEKKSLPSIVKLDSLHRFWSANDLEPEYVNQELWERANQRSILFTGKFEPVKWSCRAPLPSGKLCPRRDRVKCPFHGKIIPRDELGRPNGEGADDKSNAEESSITGAPSSSASTSRPLWEELEGDVAAALGLPEPPAKRKKGSKDCASNCSLIDINAVKNTSRTRLAKKVLSKSALQRVGDALDAVAGKRAEDKFGNQFNYAFRK